MMKWSQEGGWLGDKLWFSAGEEARAWTKLQTIDVIEQQMDAAFFDRVERAVDGDSRL
jgi:hypothetical protein